MGRSARKAGTAKGGTSLAELHPELAAQWHPTRNAPLTPDALRPGSDKRVWWRCPKNSDHEWQTAVLNRAKKGSGCPFCSGRRATVERSLEVASPELAAQWHPTRNKPLRPSDVAPKSGKLVWWRCNEVQRHEWQATPAARARRPACPYCAGHRPKDELGDPGLREARRRDRQRGLRARFAKIASEWHPKKNGKLAPTDVTPGSSRLVWWRCSSGHEWQATITARTFMGSGCPYCAGKRATKGTSLAALYPGLARQWHPTQNGALTPREVRPGSNKKVWWRCRSKHPHEWAATIASRVAGRGCPYCSGSLSSEDSSLVSEYPELAGEWHSTRNGELQPEELRPGTQMQVWWLCAENPSHAWQAAVLNRTHGNGCPYCSGRLATPETSLATVKPSLAAQWHPKRNGALKSTDVTTGSGKKVWWCCPDVKNHVWQAVIFERARRGTGCPYCHDAFIRGELRRKRRRATEVVESRSRAGKKSARTP